MYFRFTCNLDLWPLFSGFTIVLFNCRVCSWRPFVIFTSIAGLVGCRGFYLYCYVHSCRPFIILMTSFAGLVGCRRGFYLYTQEDMQMMSLERWKAYRNEHNNWMGQRWNLKIRVNPILIQSWSSWTYRLLIFLMLGSLSLSLSFSACNWCCGVFFLTSTFV